MLPPEYQLPAALLLVFAGALACFAGQRLLRVVLAVFGFIVGAMIPSSVMGITNTAGMIAAALVGGVLGAAILLFAYFLGVALIGAALGALVVAPLVWPAVGRGDPAWWLVVGLAVLGAVAAMLVQRQVIVVTTAFVGAWTLIVGILEAAGARAALAAKTGVWILYPLSPGPGQGWVPYAWVVLALAGTAVQLGLTGKKR